MEEYESRDEVDIGVFGAAAQVARAGGVQDSVEQLWLRHKAARCRIEGLPRSPT